MKKLLFLLAFTLFPFFIYGQGPTIQNMIDPLNTNVSLLYEKEGKKIKGSPFLYKDWTPVEVFTSKKNTVHLEQGKFDVCSQKVLFIKEGKEQWLQDKDVKQFYLLKENGTKETFYKAKLNTKIIYLRLLQDGNQMLFAHYQKNIVDPSKNFQQTYGVSSSKSSYFSKMKTTYLISSDGVTFKKLKTKKKQLHDAFPKEYHAAIKTYLKENKPSLKEEKEIILLVEELNKVL